MLRVYLSKSQFRTLAERMVKKSLQEKNICYIQALDYGLVIVVYEVDIEFVYYESEKSLLYDMILELTGAVGNIHII